MLEYKLVMWPDHTYSVFSYFRGEEMNRHDFKTEEEAEEFIANERKNDH